MTTCRITLAVGQPSRPLALLPHIMTLDACPAPATDPLPVEPDAEARRIAIGLAQGFVEALSGRRPIGQLARYVDADELAALAVWRASGVLDAARLASVRALSPVDGIIEASLRISTGTTSVAAAMRLERRLGAWRCVLARLLPGGAFLAEVRRSAPCRGSS